MSGKSQKMIILSEKEKKKEKHVGVSKNSGTPKSSILIGFSLINHPFWGKTPYFWFNTHVSKKLWVSLWLGFFRVGLQSHRWTKVWGEAFRENPSVPWQQNSYGLNDKIPQEILLMEEILHHLGCKKTCK